MQQAKQCGRGGSMPEPRKLSSHCAVAPLQRGFGKNCLVGGDKPGGWGWETFWALDLLGLSQFVWSWVSHGSQMLENMNKVIPHLLRIGYKGYWLKVFPQCTDPGIMLLSLHCQKWQVSPKGKASQHSFRSTSQIQTHLKRKSIDNSRQKMIFNGGLSETSFDKDTTHQGRGMGIRKNRKENKDTRENNKTENIG